jgi:hypothetical protein
MNSVFLIILILICLFIGLLAGILIASLFRSKPDQTRQDIGEKSGLVEVVRFWSDSEGTKIVPEVGGKFIRSLDELRPDQSARLSSLLERMRAGAIPSAQISKPIPTSQTAPGIPSKDENPALSEAAAVDILAAQPPVQRPKGDLVSVLANALQPETRGALFVEKSIAAQIDEVLQKKLEGTALAQKGVRLMELPGKGMVVMVGLDQYVGVGDVPDPEIQKIIHSAVREWETNVSTGQD